MNNTSGLQEEGSATFQSPSYRFLHEHQREVGTGSWHLLQAHDLIVLSTGISTMRGMTISEERQRPAAPSIKSSRIVDPDNKLLPPFQAIQYDVRGHTYGTTR